LNLDPQHYDSVPTYDLLGAAARGRIGIDHRFLRAILDRREKAVPDLVRFAAEDHADDPLNLEEELISIFRHLDAPEAIDFYLKLVREDPEQVSDELVDALVKVGRPALDPLLKLYEELGEENSGDVAFLLAALRLRDARVLQILTDRLEYDLSDAAICMDMYGDPAAIPALERALEELPQSEAQLRNELGSAIEALRQPKDAPIEPPEPFDIWGLYPEKASPAFDVLTEQERLDMFDSPSPELREEAVGSFFNTELPEKVKARLIQLAKNDPEPKVRGRAWETLIDASDEPEIRRAMQAVVDNPAAPLDERAGAIVGLAGYADTPKVRKAIEDLYANPAGRAKALEAMWRSFDPVFSDYPPRHLEDADPETRRQAIWGVGQLGLTQSAPRLRTLFDDDELRADALYNYALAMPAQVSRGRVRGMLEKVDQLAGGLSPGETELVQMALDQRLSVNGMKPVFNEDLMPDGKEENEPLDASKIGRNDPCPCGSGKKYKKCCGAA
jgi:HEAT repeat protein